MNDKVRDLNAGSDIFVYAYSSTSRTVEIKVADGLNFRLKIPTNTELANYVSNTWNGASNGHDVYDNTRPLSESNLLSNYVPTSLLTIYINSPDLIDHHYSAPSSFSSSIIKKVLVDQQLGGIIKICNSRLHADYTDVSHKSLKRLSFRITGEKSNTTNLY